MRYSEDREMLIKNWRKEVFTIPNVLSMFRLALIPVYVLIYLKAKSTEDYFLAAAILAVSCLTDLIDGKIARHFNMISNLGKILDPLADKATQLALIVCLASRYAAVRYILGVFVVKESFQLIAGGLKMRKGKMLKGALLSGKICTTVLFLSLIFMILVPSLDKKIVNIIAAVDIVFMLISFTDYVLTYIRNGAMFQKLDSGDSE